MTGVCLLLAAVLIVPVPLAPAPTRSEIERREDEFLLAYAEGNYRLCHEKLEQLIVENPAHPVSVLYYPYLFQLADIFGPAAVDATAEKIREALDRSGEKKAGAAMLRLRCVIEKLRYRLDGEKAKQATDVLKSVRRWTLFGPFHRLGPGDLDHRFEPEIVTGGSPIISQRNAIVTNYDGWLEPGRYLYPARGVVYARVSFYTEGTVKIRVYSDSVYRVFINGRSAIKNTPEDKRSARVIRITRAAGVTVLVKLWGNPVHKLRLLITSDDDRNINPIREDDKTFSGECGIEEEPEYPGSIVMAESGPRGSLHRGIYFDGLGSREAEYWYRTSIDRFKGGHVPFLLVSALLSGDNARSGTFRYEEARRLLQWIHSDYPSYVPARHSWLKLLIERGEYNNAYCEGKKALSAVPLDLHSSLVFLGLLDAMNRDREFRDAAGLIRNEYLDSPLLLEKEACFYSKRNPAARAKVMNDLLKNSFSPEQARSLIREETARGEYESALNIINSRNYNHDFTAELIDLLVKKGDYDEARSEIFKALIPGDRPDLYHYLGLIDIIQSDDPSMYFQKLLDGDPSKFGIDDYVRYIAGGNIDNPCARYYDGSVVDALRNDSGPPQSHADVLYRGRIVVITRDGSSRT
ncbi:MAG TPA: hypothetical protein PK307_13955, partial [Spirochaetota bacterium]|nr:hypothetical protein [Spirochaetota bacterium]